MIVPRRNIVIRAVLNVAFGAVAGVVQDDDNGIQLIPEAVVNSMPVI